MLKYKELLAQAAELTRQAEEARKTEMASVIADIKAKMAEYEITIDDLTPRAGTAKKAASGQPRAKVADKYRGNEGQTWTGRGMKPKWVAAHLEAGGKLEDLLINKEPATA